MRTIYTVFCFLLSLNVLVSVVQAEPRVISLNLLEQELSPLKVYQNFYIK